ncbi:unnamed protein product [Didymodactylos carnosus]|uniref:MULE transposase domain-containing protein n=1 Tax=Didymodactylos carnosus TaxID=1234261 RepID=A0A814JAX9_9BILA|nr:unnamed protein product [Didymodactylos carnosus]CAF1132690.1 unnamed protein product [Didymodactylos carnosus]CAF3806191.1 unnamed protein product [Didymodactylos carnosus]CAF3917628.1 unnamed protein product [Didymodactylos carnosus]
MKIFGRSSVKTVQVRVIYVWNDGFIKLLCDSEHIFMGGTFKSCPSPFAQAGSIHALSPILKNTVSALYTLLSDKNKITYVFLFHEVRNVTVRNNLLLNPKFITLDFERGAINALKLVFSNSIIKGCNFRFNQYLFNKLQELGFQKAFYEAHEGTFPGAPLRFRSFMHHSIRGLE